MLIESALVWFKGIETFNQAFWNLSSGMRRVKGCSLSDGSTSTVTTGSEGRGFKELVHPLVSACVQEFS
jgi:hypothetical protein